MEGQGVHVCAEGSCYEGEFRANYRHGRGRCQWGNRHETPFRFAPYGQNLTIVLEIVFGGAHSAVHGITATTKKMRNVRQSSPNFRVLCYFISVWFGSGWVSLCFFSSRFYTL